MSPALRQAHGRVALVHDFLLDVRGAERVFAEICELWPDADVFTAVYHEGGTDGRFAHRRIQTSFLQRLHPTARTFRSLLPLYPYAVESFDLRGYDLVVSSSSAWAHGVIVDEPALHVCYCHNPFRYAWSERETTLERARPGLRGLLAATLSRYRQWDWIAAQRVDRYVANSETTRQRIERYYQRDATVIHPPVPTGRFSAGGPVGQYYLVVSELMPHKRIEIAVEAFNELRLPLVVVGDGPESRHLRRIAGPDVHLEGRVSDARVSALLRGARALVVTATEEFGIAAVEAQASGRPVIALAAGGARETIREGETGTFYARPRADDLAAAVRRFDTSAVDSAACLQNAARFDSQLFAATLRDVVDEAMSARSGDDLPPRARQWPPRRRSRWPLAI